jgi:Arc/MetJ-type ribon-helix-helix transcriptional regulator
MNAERRAKLSKVSEAIRNLITELEDVRDAEQQAYDNMPEGLQQSERGQASEQAVTDIESAISNAESAADDLENLQ